MYQNSLNTEAPVVLVPSWITVSPVGRITLLKHLLVRFVCSNRSKESFTTWPKACIPGCRSPISVPSSGLENSSFACEIHGVNAVIVAGVSSTPGVRSRAKPSSWGSVASRLTREVRAFSRVGPSRWMAAVRLVCSRAKIAKKRLKFVMKSFSCSSLVPSAVVTLASPLISLPRSCGSVPSSALLTSAEPRSDSGDEVMLSFSDLAADSPCTSGSWSASSAAVGLRVSPLPRPISRSWSCSRSLVCSAVRS